MGSGNRASLIAKDLIDSEDPEDTLFCREAAFVAINKRLSVRRSACIKYKHFKVFCQNDPLFHEQGEGGRNCPAAHTSKHPWGKYESLALHLNNIRVLVLRAIVDADVSSGWSFL